MFFHDFLFLIYVKIQQIGCTINQLFSSIWLNSKAKKIKKQNIQKSFGKHLKKLRQAKGLTQLDLSSKINKDQQSLQRVESGNVNPSLFYLLELAEGLNIKLPELLDFNY